MPQVAPVNRRFVLAQMVWACTAALVPIVLMVVGRQSDPGLTAQLLCVPVGAAVAYALILPFLSGRPRSVFVGRHAGEEFVLWYFGSQFFGWRGPVRVYTTASGVWLGVWQKEFVPYGDVRHVRLGVSLFTPSLKLEVKPGRTVWLGFGRSALAWAFVRTLARHGVSVGTDVTAWAGAEQRTAD